MFECKKCNKMFRDNYNLSKHMIRIKPCTIELLDEFINNNNFVIENTTKVIENTTKCIENTTKGIENTTENNKNTTCKYCLNKYTKNYKKLHEKTCKLKNDPIRILEIENGIKFDLPESNNTCRFCNVLFCRKDVLNKHFVICKERENYKQKIKSVKVFNFGQENLNHIQTENIIELLRGIRKDYHNNQIYLMAGNLINLFDNYIRENSENNNLLIPDSKCIYAEIKITDGWEKVSVEKSLNKAFKKSANELYKKKEEIDTQNERVFKSNINKQIFSEVKHFGINGLNNCEYANELRKIKTNFKISKLKNKITN